VDKKHKILVVDDNEEVLKTISQFLRQKDYDVVSASNGLDALKYCEQAKEAFDLVVTDLVMPNISGVAIISIVKEKYPQTPVVAITGWGEHPEALATEAQANVVLEKPFELSKLNEVIMELIESKPDSID